MIEVVGSRLNLLNVLRRSLNLILAKIGFDFGGNGWSRAAAKVGFDFEPVEFGRIVACRQDNAADQIATSDFKRYIWRRVGPIHQINLEAVAREDLGCA